MSEPLASFTVCQKDKCKTLTVEDTSGLFDAVTNPNGWDPTGVTALDSAEIEVTFPDGTVTTYDVLSQIPNPITGNFSYTLTNGTSVFPDGSYKIKYTLDFVLPSVTVNSTEKCIYFNCVTKCSLASLWAKTAEEECGCDPCSGNELLETALLAEGLYRAMVSAASCGNTATADKLLARLKRIFDYNDCNCK